MRTFTLCLFLVIINYGCQDDYTESDITFDLPKDFELEELYRPSVHQQGSWVSITEDELGNFYTCDQYGKIYKFAKPDIYANERLFNDRMNSSFEAVKDRSVTNLELTTSVVPLLASCFPLNVSQNILDVGCFSQKNHFKMPNPVKKFTLGLIQNEDDEEDSKDEQDFVIEEDKD